MASKMRIGDQWGSLEVIDIIDEPTTITRDGVTDTFITTVLKIRCACAKVFTVPVGNFPGRRKMRDCGCGAAKIDEARPRSSYMGNHTWEGVRRFAKEQDLSPSRAIGNLCQFALSVMDGSSDGEDKPKGKAKKRK